MNVFARKAFGIAVTYTNGKTEKFWYGMDRDKRDREHNRYSKMSRVTVVQDLNRG